MTLVPLSELSLDLNTLQRAYATQSLHPAQLVEELYRRAAHTAHDHVWLHRRPLADVLRDVERLQRRVAAGEDLPLFGIPFGVKDNIDVQGLPTSAGCTALHHVAVRTAAVVEKLQAAGALLIGKQNMDQFATGLVGIRTTAPYCRNAFDARYVPGGSSSGSGVAVASGQVSFSIGTDTGGSGRVPAALNNVIGLKPTPGLVSNHGIWCNNRTFDVAPVFALTVADAARVLDVIQGHDPRDSYSALAPQPAHAGFPARFRFGVPPAADLEFFGDAAAQAQYTQALQTLESLGGTPVVIDFAPFLEAGRLVFGSALVAERWLTYRDVAQRAPDTVHPAVLQAIEAGASYSAAEAFENLYRLEELKHLAWAQLRTVNVLALPTAGTIYTCEAVEQQPALNSDMGYYTYFANPLRLSGLSVPAGLRGDGLPFGISLLGLPFQDRPLLQLAARFHHAVGGTLGATATTLHSVQAL